MALKEIMGRLDNTVRLYMNIEGLDLRDLYLSDTAFVFTSGADKFMTQPCVKDWGALRTFLTDSGQDRESQAEIVLFGNREVTDRNSVSTATVIRHLRETKIHDTVVTVYTWNEADNTETELWRGYCQGIVSERLDREGTEVTVRVSSRGPGLDIATVSDLPNRSSATTL